MTGMQRESCEVKGAVSLKHRVADLFNEPADAPSWRAIEGQSVRVSAGQSRPERRSNDGQAILELIRIAPDLRSDLALCVELWGFEPQTSCMPCKRSTN